MAFDTPLNRHRYEIALTEHDKWIDHHSRYGESYTRGWKGKDWRPATDDFEHWCAGRDNRKKHDKAEGQPDG